MSVLLVLPLSCSPITARQSKVNRRVRRVLVSNLTGARLHNPTRYADGSAALLRFYPLSRVPPCDFSVLQSKAVKWHKFHVVPANNFVGTVTVYFYF